MQVSLKCLATDGYMRSSEVPMTTADGDYWQAEISVVESRRSPLSSFIYYYKVVDASGFELRREWDEIPRTYLFDSSKMYTMVDQWRDRPLPYHLYSRAYAVTTRQRVDEFGLLREPLYRKTVMFRVSAPQLQTGQSVALIGSHPYMGAWNPTRYLPMKYAGRYEWMLTLNADMFDGPIEFKYVLIDEQTHQLLSW
jgi:4-alpha-glucanotransferase